MKGRDLHNMSTCFINSHLAIGVIEFGCWKKDYEEIWGRISCNNFNPPPMIKDHEIILWIGDLNCWMDCLDCVRVKTCLPEDLM